MKVLWFTGVQLPAVSGQNLTRANWQEELRKALEIYHPEIELGIASVCSAPFTPFRKGNAHYYGIHRPVSQSHNRVQRIFDQWRHNLYALSEVEQYLKLVQDFRPDVIMVFGTENPFGLISGKVDSPVILYIQGIVSAIANHLFDGLTWQEILILLFSKNFAAGSGVFHEWLTKKKYSRIEREIFARCPNFIGRTQWDQAQVLSFNPKANYFECNEILGPTYYESEWQADPQKGKTIYATSGDALFKGALTLVRAVCELKKRGRQDIRVRIGGVNRTSETGKLIERLVMLHGLQEQVVLLGRLSSGQICQEIRESSLFVLPSHMENSSNSLCEAMLMGTPCIASNAGGTPSLIKHNDNGMLYSHQNHIELASHIAYLIDNPDIAITLGKRARQTAMSRHHPEAIAHRMADIYTTVAKSHA